jgi:hypothetical protein
MTIDEFLELTNRPNHIPGIHNYCDRWCRRCPFTSRCSVFAMAELDSFEDDDLAGAVGARLDLAGELLTRFAEESGIDLEELEAEAEREWEEPEDDPEADPRSDELMREAEAYASRAAEFLGELDSRLAEAAASAAERPEAGPPVGDVGDARERVDEALEVIGHDRLLIRAKLFRALSNRDWWDADSEEVVDSDADGSAKVALIGVDRSIDAWLVLREVLPAAGVSTPARTDAALDRVADLHCLRRGIEERFPRARRFVRPGFDDPAQARDPDTPRIQ